MFFLRNLRIFSSFIISLLLVGCSSNLIPPLGGGYQSDFIQGYIVQMGIQPDDHTFVEYIDNVEVDRGTYKLKSEDVYLLKSERQEFEITLTKEDTFEIVINQLNDKEPIQLRKVNSAPILFEQVEDHPEEYIKLLEKNKSYMK